MFEHPDRIPIEECKEGHVYRLLSRNLAIGVFRVSQHKDSFQEGFIGIREKFGDRYLFEEYHWDCGAPYGTANPLEDLGPVPKDISIETYLYMYDKKTGRKICFDKTKTDEELYPGGPKKRKGYYFQDTGEYSDDIRAASKLNSPLFKFLEDKEKEIKKDKK